MRLNQNDHPSNRHRARLTRSGIILILALLFGVQTRTVLAGEKILWQIGKTDHATLEFNQRWDFSQGHDPIFIVGKSTPQKDWTGFHPGSEDQKHGSRPHPFTVVFDLAGPPRGVFYLTIDLMIKSAFSPHIPDYFIEVNGKKGRFYLHPRLSYDIGEPDTAMNPIYSTERVKVALSTADFREGENRLVLSCLGDASRVILHGPPRSWQVSGVSYDALSLSNDTAARPTRPAIKATLRPTIFYREHGSQGLFEVVVLQVVTDRKFQRGTAGLRVGGKDYTCDLTPGIDFGESECAIEVPELQGSTPVKLTARLDGTTRSWNAILNPQRKWRLYYAPQTHLDLGYWDFRSATQEIHNRNMDQIVQTMESSPDFKFNPDGSFILEDYWKHRGQGWQDRCLRLLKDGHLALPAQRFTVNTGLASQEELFRLLYTSAAFSRQYGIPLEYANQTDPPAHSWAFPSALARSGIRYLAISSNPYRGPILIHGKLHEVSPFWWEGPDGSKVLTSFARQYHHLLWLFSLEPEVSAGVNSLPIFLQSYEPYAADAVLLYGAEGDNVPYHSFQATFPAKWNKEFAYPKVITSTFTDFFRYMEQHFSTSLTTLKGDGGAWWEEMAAADARYAALSRRVKQRVLGAEAFASLGAIVNPEFTFPIELDREIWSNLLLYTEHTWGHSHADRRPESDLARVLLRDKQSFSERAEIGTDNMLRRGLSQIADRIYSPGQTMVVFNPLPWARGGLAEVDLSRGQGLLDLKTNQEVPLEVVRREENNVFGRVRFWVAEAPPLGYRSYKVTQSESAAFASVLPISQTIENRFYRIVVDPSRGGIASLYDKELGKELIDSSSPYVLDQYLYVGYGHDDVSLVRQRAEFNSTLLRYGRALPEPQLQVSAARQGKVLALKKTPWGMSLSMTSAATHTPAIETEIRIFENEKKVELVNTIHKEAVLALEAAYLAFPFAGERPTIRYEIQNAWVDPSQDQLPGANKEWFSAQGWVSVSNPGVSVGLALNEAPFLTIGDINRGRWPTSLDVKDGSLFSYIMNNYNGDDERPFQGGVFTFHYALTSGPGFDPSALARFAKEEANPLEVYLEQYPHDIPPGHLDPVEGSFVDVTQKSIVLTTWKGAEDGQGYILRFYNTTEKPVAGVVIRFPGLAFDQAYEANGIEINQQALNVEGPGIALSFAPHEIKTVRIMGFRLK